LIILEDDTIPALSFFSFCEEMLKKYENHENIGCINGSNLGAIHILDNYFISGLSLPFWGWATWKSSWNLYKPDNYYWKNEKSKIEGEFSELNKNYFSNLFDLCSVDSNNTWDIQWNWALLANGKYTVISGVNLISNKGFVPHGLSTNYLNSKFNNLKRYEISNYDLKEIAGVFESIEFENKLIELHKELNAKNNGDIYFKSKGDLLKILKFRIIFFLRKLKIKS
jgi:hypothetical protein